MIKINDEGWQNSVAGSHISDNMANISDEGSNSSIEGSNVSVEGSKIIGEWPAHHV